MNEMVRKRAITAHITVTLTVGHHHYKTIRIVSEDTKTKALHFATSHFMSSLSVSLYLACCPLGWPLLPWCWPKQRTLVHPEWLLRHWEAAAGCERWRAWWAGWGSGGVTGRLPGWGPECWLKPMQHHNQWWAGWGSGEVTGRLPGWGPECWLKPMQHHNQWWAEWGSGRQPGWGPECWLKPMQHHNQWWSELDSGGVTGRLPGWGPECWLKSMHQHNQWMQRSQPGVQVQLQDTGSTFDPIFSTHQNSLNTCAWMHTCTHTHMCMHAYKNHTYTHTGNIRHTWMNTQTYMQYSFLQHTLYHWHIKAENDVLNCQAVLQWVQCTPFTTPPIVMNSCSDSQLLLII